MCNVQVCNIKHQIEPSAITPVNQHTPYNSMQSL